MDDYQNPINVDVPIGGLKQQLSKLLLSVDRVGWQTGSTSGRFDVRRMTRLLTGSERVFKSRVETDAVTTAVTIVIDLSSSMHGERAEAASQTAWALADAIERVGCMVQVLGFSAGYGHSVVSPKYMRDMAGLPGTSSRATGVESVRNLAGVAKVFKDFSHKLRDRKVLFQHLNRLVCGNTPDYHVIRTAVQQLSMVPADRKLCIVITDGFGDVENMSKLRELSEKLWKVPVVGIGIQTDARSMAVSYKYFACIQSVQELAQGALRAVIAQLDGKKKGAEAPATA